jgi:uncharacterized LabA/DUF88 family protein
MNQSIYVFVDNSNLWIEGKKASGKTKNPPIPSNGSYRVEYGKLLNHILDNRPLGDVPKLYGSEPPPTDSVWKIIKAKGFDVKVFQRNIFNKEKGVDMKMGIDVTKLILQVSPPSIIALVVGDADFLPVIEEAKNVGWETEVWYWDNAASLLKKAATKFLSLNPYMDIIGFEQRGRINFSLGRNVNAP